MSTAPAATDVPIYVVHPPLTASKTLEFEELARDMSDLPSQLVGGGGVLHKQYCYFYPSTQLGRSSSTRTQQ